MRAHQTDRVQPWRHGWGGALVGRVVAVMGANVKHARAAISWFFCVGRNRVAVEEEKGRGG